MNTTNPIVNTACRLKMAVIIRRRLFTQIVSLFGAATLLLYSWCSNTCVYLKGTFIGIDLLYIGFAFTAVVILLTALKLDFMVIVLLASAAGVESFLIGQQILQKVYCPYCLIFGAALLFQFFINFDVRKARALVLAMLFCAAVFPLFFGYPAAPSYALEEEEASQSCQSECSAEGNSKCDAECCSACEQQGSRDPVEYRKDSETANKHRIR